ncbi:type II toxin-antitoxin system RelE/ParE family toxin [Alloalcanivorax xenomutans]|uniref:Toxin n=1 Tax=Alloalcanivorax balearicus MACL04 TaxID=1177182 RepID=A0ABT2R3G1_9GAMM|nr:MULTISPECIES: type II toxin-antitoxin system RelE/ParE family toxin [Alloalcanivorax]KYZ85058.1 plasmid stabilization protein [Alcanivorax sp. KX64203]MCU5784322.1 putative plasmid stabilization protein ParE [Alloalcanivorax balearicus MACL04]WOD26662.1 type II toxin-antitoxin system RelE/ParE family toxin [Alloalcanivorax xenomutans]
MAAPYRLTLEARKDLIQIRRFTLRQWGPKQSRKYLSDLRQTLRLLCETPSLGKPRPELGAGVFSFPHVSHVIYYIVYRSRLVIFGVLHKRMVPLNHLADRPL